MNRARFLRRYKEQIKRAVHDMVSERSITDMDRGGNVSVPRKDISEPVFRHGEGGDREIVHPGNREFVKGDRIPRPEGGGGGGGAGEPGTGESEDAFVFALSREEFLHIFFEDLELPRLERNFDLDPFTFGQGVAQLAQPEVKTNDQRAIADFTWVDKISPAAPLTPRRAALCPQSSLQPHSCETRTTNSSFPKISTRAMARRICARPSTRLGNWKALPTRFCLHRA